jgi:hypothetical protein
LKVACSARVFAFFSGSFGWFRKAGGPAWGGRTESFTLTDCNCRAANYLNEFKNMSHGLAIKWLKIPAQIVVAENVEQNGRI